MQRKSQTALQNVTGLPVLIRCEAGKEDGLVSLSQPVRVVSQKEIMNPSNRGRLKPEEWRALTYYKLLLLAQEAGDIRAAYKAAELVEPIAFKWAGPPPPKDEQGLVKWGLLNTLAEDADVLASAIARMVSDLRLVYWVRSGTRTPPARAVLCGSYHTAVAYRMFFNGIGVCPNCLNLFAKVRPQQTCCSLQCRETHRVARWRDRKAAEAAQKPTKLQVGRR